VNIAAIKDAFWRRDEAARLEFAVGLAAYRRHIETSTQGESKP